MKYALPEPLANRLVLNLPHPVELHIELIALEALALNTIQPNTHIGANLAPKKILNFFDFVRYF